MITGISTEQCCETTTRVAADLGYDVDFVTEATPTFPITDEATGEVLSTDEIVRRTEMRAARAASPGSPRVAAGRRSSRGGRPWRRLMQVIFALLPEVEVLDLAGPVQAFHEANACGAGCGSALCASEPRVRTDQGLWLSELEPLPGPGPEDLVVVPGLAHGRRSQRTDPAFLPGCAQAHERGRAPGLGLHRRVRASAGRRAPRRPAVHHALEPRGGAAAPLSAAPGC